MQQERPDPNKSLEGKPAREVRVLRQPLEPLGFHLATAPTGDPAPFEPQEDPHARTGEIVDLARVPVVVAAMNRPAGPTDCFFPRRARCTTRARESPKIPLRTPRGVKPGKRYRSRSRSCVFMTLPWHSFSPG